MRAVQSSNWDFFDNPNAWNGADGFKTSSRICWVQSLFGAGDGRVFVIREQIGGVAINCDAASFAQVLFNPAAG